MSAASATLEGFAEVKNRGRRDVGHRCARTYRRPAKLASESEAYDTPAEMSDAASRVARLGEEIRTVADRHRNDVAAAGTTLLDDR